MTILQPITHTRCSTGQIETDQIKKYTGDVSKYVAEILYKITSAVDKLPIKIVFEYLS